MLNMIVAMTKDGLIGKDNSLPWNYPEDLQHFKDETMGSIVVMGRKTWDSLPIKPLPGRINMVLTNDENWRHPGAYRTTFAQVMKLKQKNLSIWVMGGVEIYKLFFNVTDRIVLSYISKEYEGNMYFPYPLNAITNKFEFYNGKGLVYTDQYELAEVFAHYMRSANYTERQFENKLKREIKIL